MAYEPTIFNELKPSWALNKSINLDLLPLRNLGASVKYGIDITNDALSTAKDKKNALLAEQAEYIAKCKSAVKENVDDVTTKMKEFEESIDEVGGKFILLKPFSGNMDTLRNECLSSVSNRYPNYPNVPNDSTIGVFILTFNISSLFSELSGNVLLQLARYVYSLVGKHTDTNIITNELSKSPLNSAFSTLAMLNPLMNKAVKDDWDKLQADPLEFLGLAVQMPQDILTVLQDDYNNSELKNLIGDPFNVETPGPVGQLVNGIKTALTPSTDIPIAITSIDAFSYYKVINKVDDLENDPFKVTYNGAEYFDGESFRGLPGNTNFTTNYPNESKPHKYDDSKGYLKKTSDAIDLFGEYAGNNLLASGLNEFGERGIKTLSGEELSQTQLFNQWFEVLGLGSLFTGGFKNMLKDANNLVTQVSGGVFSAVNLGMSAVSWANYYADSLMDKAGDALTSASNIIDKIPNDMTAVGLDVFCIPPKSGGLDYVRFIINEWMHSNIEDAPVYTNGTVFMPIILTYTDAGAISLVAQFLKPFGATFDDTPPPEISEATNIGPCSFTANWVAMPSILYYELCVSKDNFETYLPGCKDVRVDSNTVEIFQYGGLDLLDPASTYQYKVRAKVDKYSRTSYSEPMSVTTLSATAPVALDGTNIDQLTFTANWEPVPFAIGYEVDVSKDNFQTFEQGYASKKLGADITSIVVSE